MFSATANNNNNNTKRQLTQDQIIKEREREREANRSITYAATRYGSDAEERMMPATTTKERNVYFCICFCGWLYLCYALVGCGNNDVRSKGTHTHRGCTGRWQQIWNININQFRFPYGACFFSRRFLHFWRGMKSKSFPSSFDWTWSVAIVMEIDMARQVKAAFSFFDRNWMITIFLSIAFSAHFNIVVLCRRYFCSELAEPILQCAAILQKLIKIHWAIKSVYAVAHGGTGKYTQTSGWQLLLTSSFTIHNGKHRLLFAN